VDTQLHSSRAALSMEGIEMSKVLVVHGLGMNMRGRVKRELFGAMTLAEYDEQIRVAAQELGFAVDIFQSNFEGEIVNKLYDAVDRNFAGAVINPAGFSIGYRGLTVAIEQLGFPVVEVHVSNPANRGIQSDVGKVCRATVTGFGVAGYRLALAGLKGILAPAR
jgi:3-dehydroquinate dehydratase II